MLASRSRLNYGGSSAVPWYFQPRTSTGAVPVLKAGAAYVPLDPTYPADRLSLMLEDSGISVVLTRQSVSE